MPAPPPIDWKKKLQGDIGLPSDYDPEQGPVRDAGMPPPRVQPANPEIQGDAPVYVPLGEPGDRAPGPNTPDSNYPAGARGQQTAAMNRDRLGPPPVPMPKPAPPQGPPPMGQEERTYNDMLRAGPKRSVWGTIGAAAVRGLAGYQNAGLKIGQHPVQLDKDRLNGWEQRDPVHGGPWQQGLERQKDLAAGEIDQRKRDEAWQKLQSENEDRAAQARQRESTALWEQSRIAGQDEQNRILNDWRKSEADAREEQLRTMRSTVGAQSVSPERAKQLQDAGTHSVYQDRRGNWWAQRPAADQRKEKLPALIAEQHGVYVSPEDKARGYVEIDRSDYDDVIRAHNAKPREDPNYWIAQRAGAVPGSAEWKRYDQMVKDAQAFYQAEHPPRPESPTASHAKVTAAAQTLMGGLVKQYGNDHKAIRAAIASADVDDAVRAEADRMAITRKKLDRDPKEKGSSVAGLAGDLGVDGAPGPPSVGSSGGRGGRNPYR